MYKSCKKCGGSKGGKLVIHTECGNSGCNQGGVRAAERNSCEDRIIEISPTGGTTCRACGKILYGLDKIEDL